jgi:hypothetical protein
MAKKQRPVDDHKLVEAAKRYAAADRSDPFAYRRALCHLSNGVAHWNNGSPRDPKDGFYDAEEYQETRHMPPPFERTEYKVIAYKNMARP